jgi:hypothetical protein
MSRFRDVQQILDRVLGGRPLANHGMFWRGVTRDQFIALQVFGLRMVVPGEPGRSGVMSALKGAPPFTLDNDAPNARPPASEQDIATVSTWIARGCPDEPASAMGTFSAAAAGVTISDNDHVQYWRGVDFFFLPGLSSPETNQHVGRIHILAFFKWKESHLLGGGANAWEDYMAAPNVPESFKYVRHHCTRLIEEAYGSSQDNLFDSLWKFGANLLPPDPQGGVIPDRRTMNSPYDWFFWVPYIDMSLRASDAGDADLRLARAWQVGIAADGLKRGRLIIPDFDANDPGVDQKVKATFETSQKDDLLAGMRSRAEAFPTSPFFDGWPGP